MLPLWQSSGDRKSPSPHGEGGLKFLIYLNRLFTMPSLPAWGGWIEITTLWCSIILASSPSPHGEGGLKCAWSACRNFAAAGPSPHGEGGLKCREVAKTHGDNKVPPRMGRVD